MKILVTGGGGFLGEAIVKQLIAKGHEVRVFSRRHFPHLEQIGVESISGDIANFDQVLHAARDCEVIFHVAAKAGVWGEYDSYYKPNVVGTENIIQAAKSLGIKRIVHTSSPSVIFDGKDHEGCDESLSYPESYIAHYPATKAIAERLMLEANSDRLATVALRPHLIWGPNDPHLVSRIVEMAKKGRLKFVGSADKKIDTVWVENAAEAHILAMENLEIGSKNAGKAYFITNDEPWGAETWINGILSCVGEKPVSKRVPFRVAYFTGAIMEWIFKTFKLSGEPPLTRFMATQLGTSHWYSNQAAFRDFGYKPRISNREGLKLLRKHFEKSHAN